MIDTVINNIKLIPDYYSKGTLPFVVAEEDQLFQKYKDSGMYISCFCFFVVFFFHSNSLGIL